MEINHCQNRLAEISRPYLWFWTNLSLRVCGKFEHTEITNTKIQTHSFLLSRRFNSCVAPGWFSQQQPAKDLTCSCWRHFVFDGTLFVALFYIFLQQRWNEPTSYPAPLLVSVSDGYGSKQTRHQINLNTCQITINFINMCYINNLYNITRLGFRIFELTRRK